MTEATEAVIFNRVIGTAGHIDHGKSSLVRSLTGVDPDRLKEERDRAMTIDLGFAPLILPDGQKVGIIDVPGHERFIKNMVAGATGIDLCLLVVAADDGVMPQTREHLEIMQLLGLERGVVALTKIDLAEDILVEIVEEDLREYLQGTFLAEAPIVRCSAITGEGIEELQAALSQAIEEAGPRPIEGPFRMPIQRVFSVKGFGTVVTGVPMSGRLRIGDEVEILPAGLSGRVRTLQAYGKPVEEARAGHSSALNLSDVDYKQVERGDVACTPGQFEPAKLFEATFDYLGSTTRPLRNHTTIRCHIGTRETLGKLVILDHGGVLLPGQSSLCQLRLDDPVVAIPGDRYILRLHSPMITIGGGHILGQTQYRLKPGKKFVIDKLEAKSETLDDPQAFVATLLESAELEPMTREQLGQASGLSEPELLELLEPLLEAGEAVSIGRRERLVHGSAMDTVKRRLMEAVEGFFEEHPLRLYLDRLALRGRLKIDDDLFEAGTNLLREAGRLSVPDRHRLGLAGRTPQLDEHQQQLKGQLDALFAEEEFRTSRPHEAAEKLGADEKLSEALIELLVEEGVLIPVDKGELFFHRDAVAEAEKRLRAAFEDRERLSATDYRKMLDTSRKYVIPLLEYFDGRGLTRMVEGERILTG